MNSGLYAWAGASATASAAAWAKRFDEPMTKRSNVYFGLSSTSGPSRKDGSGSRTRGDSDAGRGRSAGGCSATENETTSSRPTESRAALETKPWKWLSIQSRVKSFGTATSSEPSLRERGSAWPNQVSQVDSLSVSRRRSAIESQTPLAVSSAVGSVECSNPSCGRSPSRENGEHISVRAGCKRARRTLLWMKKPIFCRAFSQSTPLSTAVEDCPSVRSQENSSRV